MLNNKHGPPKWTLIEAVTGKGDPRLLYGSRGDPPLLVGTRGDPWGWLYDKKKVTIIDDFNVLEDVLKINKISSFKRLKWEKSAQEGLTINDQRLTIKD